MYGQRRWTVPAPPSILLVSTICKIVKEMCVVVSPQSYGPYPAARASTAHSQIPVTPVYTCSYVSVTYVSGLPDFRSRCHDPRYKLCFWVHRNLVDKRLQASPQKEIHNKQRFVVYIHVITLIFLTIQIINIILCSTILNAILLYIPIRVNFRPKVHFIKILVWMFTFTTQKIDLYSFR